MEVEGKPQLPDYGGGNGKGVDLRGDSAHHTDVESTLMRKSLVDAKGYARCGGWQALADSLTVFLLFYARGLCFENAFLLCQG